MSVSLKQDEKDLISFLFVEQSEIDETITKYILLKRQLTEKLQTLETDANSSKLAPVLKKPKSIIVNSDLFIDPQEVYTIEDGLLIKDIFFDAVKKITPIKSSDIQKKTVDFANGFTYTEYDYFDTGWDVTSKKLNDNLRYLAEKTRDPLTKMSDPNYPKVRKPTIKFNKAVQIETFKKEERILATTSNSKTKNSEKLENKVRETIKRAHNAFLEGIQQRMVEQNTFLDSIDDDTHFTTDSPPPFEEKNFNDYIKSCNYLSQIIANMVILTKDSLRLLLSLRNYLITPEELKKLTDILEELNKLDKIFPTSEEENLQLNLLNNASNYFDDTTKILISINKECTETFNTILKLNSSRSGKNSREKNIYKVAVQLLEQNISLFNNQFELYKLYKEKVECLITLIIYYIGILTSPPQAGTFDYKLSNGKYLSELDQGLSGLFTSLQGKGEDNILQLSPDNISLLEKSHNREKAIENSNRAISRVVDEFSKVTENNSILDVVLFLFKITALIVIVIVTFINVTFSVPFNKETGEYQIVNSKEFFKLKIIKHSLDNTLRNITNVGSDTSDAFSEIQETLLENAKFKSDSLNYLKEAGGKGASGGARKLTKKRRKKNAQTKNQRRRRNQTLRKKRSNTKSKSRRKTRHYRK